MKKYCLVLLAMIVFCCGVYGDCTLLASKQNHSSEQHNSLENGCTIKRAIHEKIKRDTQFYNVVALLGWRQAGKTTLARTIFDKHTYIDFGLSSLCKRARDDPQGFLLSLQNSNGIIFDEIQNVPDLLDYIRADDDKSGVNGYYVLVGQYSDELWGKICTLLAGRVVTNTLLPLSVRELDQAGLRPENVFELIYRGMYPGVQNRLVSPAGWYRDSIEVPVEFEAWRVKKAKSFTRFSRFIALCAGRIGRVINFSSLASDAGISVNTARDWVSFLERHHVLFRVETFKNKVSKRTVKSPKIYFYDTGLACSLLGINSVEQLHTHYLYDKLFESFVFSELAKGFYNRGMQPQLYFWRDYSSREINCIIKCDSLCIPLEIKGTMTPKREHFARLSYWNERADNDTKNSFVIYAQNNDQSWPLGMFVSWRNVDSLVDLASKQP